MQDIVTAQIQPGQYVAASGCHMLGRITADHWFGFWAQPLDQRPATRFDTLVAAGEFLALEFALHYGESVSA